MNNPTGGTRWDFLCAIALARLIASIAAVTGAQSPEGT